MIINDFVDLDCLIHCIEQIDELIKTELKIDVNFDSSAPSLRVLVDSTNLVAKASMTTIAKTTSTLIYETSVEMKENNRRHVFVNWEHEKKTKNIFITQLTDKVV